MKAVCICFEVHLPLPLRWYWPREGYGEAHIEKYFDMEKAFHNFTKLQKNVKVLNDTLAKSIENGGKFTLDISGVFLEQCRWAPEIIDGFRKLNSDSISFAASPYYHSVCSLYPETDELRKQAEMDLEIIREMFGREATTFVNTELIFEKRSMEVLREMGFKCIISEGSPNMTDGNDPVHVYESDVPLLLRHINLSEDLEIKFCDSAWPGYPLITDKYASWIAGMKGDIVTLCIKYDAINSHLQNNKDILGFLRNIPLSLKKQGIKMILPEEAVRMFDLKKLPAMNSMVTARYGMHNLLGNHAQHFYMYELQDTGRKIQMMRNSPQKEEILKIYRYLQQSEIFLEMNSEERRLGYEKAVSNFSLLSDIKRIAIKEAWQ